MDFFNLYAQGFARVAAATLPVADFDPATNAERIVEMVRRADAEGVAVLVFPELSVSGYAIDDLLLNDSLLDAVIDSIARIAAETAELKPLFAVGAPVHHGNRLYNCAVVIHRGQVLGVVPKLHLPNYREFYEKRHFASGAHLTSDPLVVPRWSDEPILFDPELIFSATDVPGLRVHVELCEDLWVPIPPSHEAALAGATVTLNLSASPITIGRANDRRGLAAATSKRCLGAYVYAAAMFGESTTDLAWDGHTMIHELGTLLAEGERFPHQGQLTVADVDLERIRQERMRQGSFDDNRLRRDPYFTTVEFEFCPPGGDLGLRRALDRFPFVPNDPAQLEQDCYEGYNIQVSGLERRMLAIGGGDPTRAPKLCIGVSGGLDSTHALIVAAKACDRLGLPRTHILAWTMPGFATTEHTRSNAQALSEALGVTFEVVDIRPMATQMLADLGHPYAEGQDTYDITFENVQAGIRYDFLFRAANHLGGIVVGTGDMSELALGWCTYGVGDQMSHYGVNAGVPKTLIQHLIRWVISSGQFDEQVGRVLASVLDTEISPELIPTRPGEVPQSTEATIGPYELQDFTLYHLLRHGMRPRRIAYLAHQAWRDVTVGDWPAGLEGADRHAYDLATIRHWLQVFVRRFATNQFKRSALPNGPKVVSGGSLSPRGDWRMPSDVTAQVWLEEIERDIPS
ncbi:MAG: NAD(+) synthase [Propionibacteriaceae bacterium]|nr:NAD(+) synthase [Propionibacteriaceae bacterium]